MRAILNLILILAIAGTSCSEQEGAGEDGAIDVVTTVYPLAYATERVGGDAVTVTNLTPPGGEPHDLELAPDDLERLAGADLVVLIGGGFQPAVEEAIEAASPAVVLDAAEGVGRSSSTDELEAGGGEDPHVWLDPLIYADIADRISSALGGIDPARAESIAERSATLRTELESLDDEFRVGLEDCRTRVMFTSHEAFGYLADAYGLEQRPLAGLSPEAEPDPARLADLAAQARASGATTVFTEDLVPAEVAQTLATEAGLVTARLSPLEGLTDEQAAAGADYLSVMRDNLESLRDGLACS
jgi:zinc transport system substrate-binding protein